MDTSYKKTKSVTFLLIITCGTIDSLVGMQKNLSSAMKPYTLPKNIHDLTIYSLDSIQEFQKIFSNIITEQNIPVIEYTLQQCPHIGYIYNADLYTFKQLIYKTDNLMIISAFEAVQKNPKEKLYPQEPYWTKCSTDTENMFLLIGIQNRIKLLERIVDSL